MINYRSREVNKAGIPALNYPYDYCHVNLDFISDKYTK